MRGTCAQTPCTWADHDLLAPLFQLAYMVAPRLPLGVLPRWDLGARVLAKRRVQSSWGSLLIFLSWPLFLLELPQGVQPFLGPERHHFQVLSGLSSCVCVCLVESGQLRASNFFRSLLWIFCVPRTHYHGGPLSLLVFLPFTFLHPSGNAFSGSYVPFCLLMVDGPHRGLLLTLLRGHFWQGLGTLQVVVSSMLGR